MANIEHVVCIVVNIVVLCRSCGGKQNPLSWFKLLEIVMLAGMESNESTSTVECQAGIMAIMLRFIRLVFAALMLLYFYMTKNSSYKYAEALSTNKYAEALRN